MWQFLEFIKLNVQLVLNILYVEINYQLKMSWQHLFNEFHSPLLDGPFLDSVVCEIESSLHQVKSNFFVHFHIV